MTKIDTKAARALCEAATKGEWCATGGRVDSYAGIAWCGASSAHGVDGRSQVIDDKQADRNAAFIAAARTLLPDALDEIDRLRALLAEARLYVEAFDCEEGGAGETLGSIKVDIPLEGRPRQWAVRAATASLARIDEALAP